MVLGAAGLVVTTVTATSADVEALRPQGLPARAARRVEAWTPVSIVVVALLAGTISAAIAWWTVGDRLPVLAGSPEPAARLPDLARALGTVLAAGAVLTTTALLATTLRTRSRS